MKRIHLLIVSIFFLQFLSAQQQNLEYYLSQGLQNSPLLKDYNNRLKSAIIDSLRLKAEQGLQIDANSSNYAAPVIQGWGYDEVKTDLYQVEAVVGVSKIITGRNNLRNKYQSIRLQNESTLLEGNLSQKDLRKAIVSQYVLAFGDQQQHLLNAEVLEIMKKEEQIIKKLTEGGIYKQTEYLSFLVNLRQQELVTSQSVYLFKNDLEYLNLMCGLFDTTYIELSDPELSIGVPTEPRNTVFFKQFVTDSLKLINADRQIDFDYRPKLSLYADGGYLSSLTYAPLKNFGMSAGFNLTAPIYDGRQKKMQHDQTFISETTRAGYQNYFTEQYKQNIAMLTRQLSSNEVMARQVREQMSYAQTLVDANRLLLDSGDISITDYLLSVNNYLTAKNMLIENTVQRFNIINELNYWNEK
jgi:outer membrane protein TolC